jgi:trans-aconitate methyltransferase
MRINYWDHAAVRLNDAELREAILAGAQDGKPFEPDALQVTWPVRMAAIVDYGCGLGRNWPLLLQHATTVYAFDRAAMLVRALRLPVPEHVEPTQHIHTLGPVDLVFMSLVLQHIPLDELDDLWSCLPPHHYLHVQGRARHDEGGPTFALIPPTMYFPLQVAMLGSEHTDEEFGADHARRDETETHYEILYQRRGR